MLNSSQVHYNLLCMRFLLFDQNVRDIVSKINITMQNIQVVFFFLSLSLSLTHSVIPIQIQGNTIFRRVYNSLSFPFFMVNKIYWLTLCSNYHFNKCLDRSQENMTDRRTNQPTNRPSNRQIGSCIGKLRENEGSRFERVGLLLTEYIGTI